MSRDTKMTLTRREAVAETERQLSLAGIEEASYDAKFLFYYVTGLKQTDLLFDGHLAMSEEQQEQLEKLAMRRAEHEPLQYITGVQDFMGMEFKVTPAVLIPRQDTERLVEEALPYCSGKTVLDMCTGSGCIAVSISKLCENSNVTAVDISEEALQVATENASRLEATVRFVQSNLFQNIKEKYDVIISNPPYIASAEVDKLMPEVREHEPRLALDGTEDGLKFYREIIKEAPRYLQNDGMVLFEIGYDQAEAVTDLLKTEGFGSVFVRKDYAGLDRVVGAHWQNGDK